MSSVPLTSELSLSPAPFQGKHLTFSIQRCFPQMPNFTPILQARAGVHMLLLDSRSFPSLHHGADKGAGKRSCGRDSLIPFPSKFQPPKPHCGEKQPRWPGLQPADPAAFSWKRGWNDTHKHTQSCFPGSCHHPKARGWDGAAQGKC